MREKLKRLALPLAAAVLALLCLVCLIIYSALADSLDSQHQAERWQGDGELEFSQLSCFMSVDQKLTLDQVYSFRKTMMDKFHEAALAVDVQVVDVVEIGLLGLVEVVHQSAHRQHHRRIGGGEAV